jgi:hypothetical protein
MISRRAYYGGRPSSSGSSKGTKSKSPKSPKPVSRAILNRILNDLCLEEMNQCAEHQHVWTAVMAKHDDSHLGKLGRMSYVTLETEYGISRADYNNDGQSDAVRFRDACLKAAAKRKGKGKSRNGSGSGSGSKK